MISEAVYTLAIDFLETTGILALLGIHPSQPRWLAAGVGLCTFCKWIAGAATIGALLIGRMRVARV